jgi:hypothetical protein
MGSLWSGMMCRLCPSDEPTRNINIFPFGSEGLEVCHTCEMKLVAYVRDLAYKNSLRKKEEYIKEKKENNNV